MKVRIVAEFRVQYEREVEIDQAEWDRLDARLTADEPFDTKPDGFDESMTRAEAEELVRYMNGCKPTFKALNFLEVHGESTE